MIWTDRQRGAVIAVTAALLLLLLGRYFLNPSFVDDPAPVYGPRSSELLSRVDPNAADLPTLTALPTIGESMANRIIEDREAYLREHPGGTPYAKLEDLSRVKGIGEATLKTLQPYLVFPAVEPEGDGP